MRFTFPILRLCTCGSGQLRRDLRDVRGIFCTFVCDACEPRRRAVYDPLIFDTATTPTGEPVTGN